jgi:hypothetical protein
VAVHVRLVALAELLEAAADATRCRGAVMLDQQYGKMASRQKLLECSLDIWLSG